VSQRANDTRDIEDLLQARQSREIPFHFERSRLNDLFMEAVKYPLVVVCAGAGYGKTSAVHDFTAKYDAATTWVQISEMDNVEARFWESYIRIIEKTNPPFAKAVSKLGFPDTGEKINIFLSMLYKYVDLKRRLVVMDDFHNITEPSVIRFVEESTLFKLPQGTSVILISRTPPQINVAGMIYKDMIFNISENDLRFTENELAQFFHGRNISIQPEDLREVMQDTGGWAFAINLIARSYQKAPGYAGYIRDAMKTNIFRFIETEIWDKISERLQSFLARLSLIDHLSFNLIGLLTGGDETLIAEFERQNAYIRRAIYMNAYIIHPLFLEFLRQKQDLLSEDEKRETYKITGDWCNKNGFRIDALSYYEKIGDYQSIVYLLLELPAQMPDDIARYAAAIFDRAPPDDFDKVEYLAEMHMRAYIFQGLCQKALDLAKQYEAKFLSLPMDDIDRKRTLARIYMCWSYTQTLIGLTNDVYDFDTYMGKACALISTSIDPGKLGPYCPGAWTICVGVSRKGAPEEYIDVMFRNQVNISASFISGLFAGEAELGRGELEFYRGDAAAAVPYVELALKKARDHKQWGLIHRALYATLRIAALQGNFDLTEQAIKETKDQLNETEYLNRFLDYDISLSWYYCFLGLPERSIDWVKEDFSPSNHPGFIENFGNQIKARYCYAVKRFQPLLAFIDKMRKRDSFLFERIELLAMESCVYYKMEDEKKAFSSLLEAYETALPNDILLPFIELGKDMRTLTAVALKHSGTKIPKPWLELVNSKSSSYAKRRTHLVMEYKKAYAMTGGIVFSPREAEILADLSHGLSRVEIAANHGLSVSTIKMVINTLYAKVGAENLADLIRIAVEQKLV